MDLRHSDKKKKGYVTLLSVIILSAVALVVVTTNLLTNIDNTTSISAFESSKISLANADTCAEKAIDKLKANILYTGNETLTLTNGSCTIMAITGTGNTNRSVQVTGTNKNTVKKLLISISVINPTTNITSWQEVADF